MPFPAGVTLISVPTVLGLLDQHQVELNVPGYSRQPWVEDQPTVFRNDSLWPWPTITHVAVWDNNGSLAWTLPLTHPMTLHCGDTLNFTLSVRLTYDPPPGGLAAYDPGVHLLVDEDEEFALAEGPD